MSTAEWPRPAENVLQPGTKRRPARSRQGNRRTANEPVLAGFVALDVRAIDAEKWPVSTVVWWQPDLALASPESSGLRNERRHKMPAAGFLHLDLAPVLTAGAASVPEPAAPSLPLTTPRSDLTPAGWEARNNNGKGKE